jgi:hypothetical protein
LVFLINIGDWKTLYQIAKRFKSQCFNGRGGVHSPPPLRGRVREGGVRIPGTDIESAEESPSQPEG